MITKYQYIPIQFSYVLSIFGILWNRGGAELWIKIDLFIDLWLSFALF